MVIVRAERQSAKNIPAMLPKDGSLQLHGLSYDSQEGVIAGLLEAVDRAGGWVLERQATSAHASTVWIEMQSRVLVEIYAAIAGSEVHLTRESHQLLAERCNCLQNLRAPGRLASLLTVRLEVAFLNETLLQASWIKRLAGGVVPA